MVPGTVRVVVVTPVPGMNDKAKPPAPLTVTDRGRVRRLVSLVNGLSLAPRGVFTCMMDDGRGVRLTFLSSPGRTVLANALAKSSGCGGVRLTIGARTTALGLGPSAARQALAISGMNWKLFGYMR